MRRFLIAAAMLLAPVAVRAQQDAAAAAADCPALVRAPPEGLAEYLERFNRSYTRPPSGEIALALTARAEMRAATRVLENRDLFGLTLSKRFCGLPYAAGPGGVDCAPADTRNYDDAWMSNCAGVRPIGNATCLLEDAGRGEYDWLKYLQSVFPAMLVSIVIAIAAPIGLGVWYLSRRCG